MEIRDEVNLPDYLLYRSSGSQAIRPAKPASVALHCHCRLSLLPRTFCLLGLLQPAVVVLSSYSHLCLAEVVLCPCLLYRIVTPE